VDASQRVALNESLQPFDPERELAESEPTLPRKPAFAKPLQVLGQRVVRPIDDPGVFAASALHGGLNS